MREIQAELLTSTVAQMCIRANYDLPCDVLRQLQSAQAEDRRLFYVAMTRAKDELTLFDYPDAPSAFIREAQGYLPVPVRAKDDFAAIVPENACGLRYRHETHG